MATRHEAPESPRARVADIVEAFLAWASTHTKPTTFSQYEWYGQKLAEEHGRILARDLIVQRKRIDLSPQGCFG
jgi:hypothetical protein